MYNNFAYIYDTLTADINYAKWADYIESIFKKNNQKPSLILELGCGTGSLGIEMTKRGYEMICLDISPDMLNCAMHKANSENLDILFLNRDMTNFELYGTVDVILCLLDSINYLTNPNQLRKMFKLVKNYLNPGGLFIFDVNTQYKFENILSDNVFYEIQDDITYIWNNSYNSKTKKARFDLTFFVKQEELYQRFDETHFERSYSHDEIMNFIDEAGLKHIASYDELKFRKPVNQSNRVFYVCFKS